ncbi:protein containing Phosphotransferase system, fructose-specific IIB subunit domain protein, partial [human gut metagenome]
MRPEAPQAQKNVLTAEEIEAADCIIVAADAKVPMDRFNGKKV